MPNRPSLLPRYFRLVMAGLHRNMVLWGGIVLVIPIWASAENPGNESLRENVPPVSLPSDSLRQTFDFDIPALPLVDALDRYAAVTHRSALFRSALVAGRVSSPVYGHYSPQEALRMLLSGSGLVAQAIDPAHADAFFLKPINSSGQLPSDKGSQPAPPYDGLVRTRIWAALCKDLPTEPGGYRALIRFYIDPTGRISRASLIDSSGDQRRDNALLTILQRVRVGRPPPEMVQPVTMLVLPQTRVAGRLCRHEAP